MKPTVEDTERLIDNRAARDRYRLDAIDAEIRPTYRLRMEDWVVRAVSRKYREGFKCSIVHAQTKLRTEPGK